MRLTRDDLGTRRHVKVSKLIPERSTKASNREKYKLSALFS